MKILSLPQNARFSNKEIFAFFLPILFENLMIAGLNIADTTMVSYVGESAVAGVSLVSRIDTFVKQFMVAFAQGGSVVLAQYIGAEDEKNAQNALKTNVKIVFAIGFLIMSLMIVFKSHVLSFLFGGAERDVIENSLLYFSYTAVSYPFFALYNVGTASFRAVGETRIPFVAAVIMMIINLILKYIFIFWFDMGTLGAAVSTLISVVIVGITLIALLHTHYSKIRISGLFKPEFDTSLAKRILGVSFPNGIENGMFQLGALAIAGLVSGLGTAAIAADALARSVSPLIHSAGSAFSMALMVIVGQCMGAGDCDEAEMYAKHVLKIDYIFTFFNGILLILFLNPLLNIFGVSDEAIAQAHDILLLYTCGSMLLYPSSFALPSALRGSGDTKTVMMVSVLSMFVFRIGAAYIFVNVFRLGVIGTWVAMVSDWVIRGSFFWARFLHGKWKQNKVI